MRIPAEILTLYLSERDVQRKSDGARAEPVRSASSLHTSFSSPNPERREKRDNEDKTPDHPRQERRFTERRKQERRQKNLPILLDTRIDRRRQSPEQHPRIDEKI